MKMKKRLLKNRGFTLIECMIAIAVFAVLASMVLVILSGTMTLSKKASENETGLSGLVENVVEDSSIKRYHKNDSDSFKMAVDGESSDFVMSYAVVDGFKNYVQCPGCNKLFSLTDCMGNVATSSEYMAASADDKADYNLSHWYKTSIKLKCPECSNEFFPSFECKACGSSGPISNFFYDNKRASLYCSKTDCGSSSLISLDSSGKLITETADSSFVVSGIASNAVRYGSVEFPAIKDNLIQIAISKFGLNDSVTVDITHQPDPNPNLPGVYTLKVSGLSGAIETGSEPGNGTFSFSLPAGYDPQITSVSPNSAASIVHPYHASFGGTEYSSVKIIGVDPTSIGDSVTVKFTLTNELSDADFAFDYPEQKLNKDWFGLTSTSVKTGKPADTP